MNATSEIQPKFLISIEGFTRQAVRDVFKEMLVLEVDADEALPLPSEAAGQIVGSVGFIGEVIGVVYLSAGASFGTEVTCSMLGLTETEVDDAMINDAFGELCNMVVGSVKSRLCDLGFPCVLTVPSIVRGNNLRIQTCAETKRIAVGFRAGEQRLLAEVMVKVP